MDIRTFMKKKNFSSVQLIKNPHTGKRFASFDDGVMKMRVSSKLEKLGESYVSWFEDTQDFCVCSTQNQENVLQTLTM